MWRSMLLRAHHTEGQEVIALGPFHVARVLRTSGAWLSAVPLLLTLLLADLAGDRPGRRINRSVCRI